MVINIGVVIFVGVMLIISFNILGKFLMGLVFFVFLSVNLIYIGFLVVIYFVLWVLFRKNKISIFDYLEK